MKKIILVSATHWDREWYFTENTSSVLLQRFFKDLSDVEHKFTLDGQSSLLENYVETENVEPKLKKLMEDGNLQIGPLYAQSDVLNSTFGTTQYNILYGKKTIEEFGAKKVDTVFMPDTFGFNEQLPQIFVKNGYSNFTFWRGMKIADQSIGNSFWWKGIDGTKINATAMLKGYGLGTNSLPFDFRTATSEQQFETFKNSIYDYIELVESFSNQNVYFIPLSGDQLPISKNLPNFVNRLNKLGKYKFEFGIMDDYFNEFENNEKPVIDYFLYYSGFSKIHRTIHSNRYDNKKLFRTIERNVYFKMEQVELMYEQLGGKPLSQKYKDKRIYKPLLETSAHDSLGGCNSDTTNELVHQRLVAINETVTSYIYLMLNDMKKLFKVNNDEYIIFNFAPFVQDVFYTDIISTSRKEKINYEDEETSVIEYETEDLTFHEVHSPVFNHHVAIWSKNMKPFSWRKIKLSDKEIEKISKTNVITDGEQIKVNIDNKAIAFRILIEDNLGDEFDFSTDNSAQKLFVEKINIISTHGTSDLNQTLIHAEGVFKNISIKFEIDLISNNKNIDLKIKVNNTLKDVRVSLVFDNKFNLLSRHLAFIKQQVDHIPNWKELGYRDLPVPNYPQDGLVQLDNGLNIYTSGTNEVEIQEDHTKIILYRTSGLLGQPNTHYRPGVASGLSYKVKTPMAQLLKSLEFDFRFSFGNAISELNSWNFQGIGMQDFAVDVLNKRIERLPFNDVLLDDKKIRFIPINHTKVLIGLYNADCNNGIKYIAANPTEEKVENFNPYEIKWCGDWKLDN